MSETKFERRQLTQEDTIPLETAQQWIGNWRSARKDSSWWQDHIFNAFLVPHADLVGLLAEGAVDARAYLGITDDNEMKLIFVGVDADGKDMINSRCPIYDFTTPCPPICDLSSPLM